MFGFHILNHGLREAKAGTQAGQELNVQSCFLACFLWLAPPAVFQNPGPPAQGTTHKGAEPSPSITN